MRKRLSDVAIEAWAELVRTQQALLQNVEKDLKVEGLPPLEWYDVLLELERAGVGGLRHREVYPRLLLAKYNLSRLIDRLEREGLVVRDACVDDGRGAQITITNKGRALRRRIWVVYSSAIDRHFASKLGQEDTMVLSRILSRLR